MANGLSLAQKRFFLIGIPVGLVAAVVATFQYLGLIWSGSQVVVSILCLAYWVIGGYLVLLRKNPNRRTETSAPTR